MVFIRRDDAPRNELGQRFNNVLPFYFYEGGGGGGKNHEIYISIRIYYPSEDLFFFFQDQRGRFSFLISRYSPECNKTISIFFHPLEVAILEAFLIFWKI